jgi:hypothetical protein
MIRLEKHVYRWFVINDTTNEVIGSIDRESFSPNGNKFDFSANQLRQIAKWQEEFEDKFYSSLDHSKCAASTASDEDLDADGSAQKPWKLTFGQGQLSFSGYWQVPCKSCARQAEKRDGVPVNSYWPPSTQETK